MVVVLVVVVAVVAMVVVGLVVVVMVMMVMVPMIIENKFKNQLYQIINFNFYSILLNQSTIPYYGP